MVDLVLKLIDRGENKGEGCGDGGIGTAEGCGSGPPSLLLAGGLPLAGPPPLDSLGSDCRLQSVCHGFHESCQIVEHASHHPQLHLVLKWWHVLGGTDSR
ncbi:hypothetical protein PoB_006739500 [Plakobranchus ocellatus]|uniref:Uncharacterized protein n=1 Tax=Plakobranchus ocellatus TaxID=259542 RepID=A0AAV4DAA2_9GAST|nr:hypothetical protein PoB_006739500 [Plakobranchus ocellatus]